VQTMANATRTRKSRFLKERRPESHTTELIIKADC